MRERSAFLASGGFPSADAIALALVAAARFYDEDPLSIARGVRSRARLVAIAALKEAFPDASWAGLARCCGHPTPSVGQPCVQSARKCRWWRETHVAEVAGALKPGGTGDEEPEDAARPAIIAPALDFSPEERRLISRMWRGGASPVAIGATVGADADTIRAFARAHPALCPARQSETLERTMP